MNPSKCILRKTCLPDGPVQPVIKCLRTRGQMRLQYLHTVRLKEFMHGGRRIFQIRKLPCACRTHFAARRRQSLCDAVVTQTAFLGCLSFRIQKAATVGASLNAVAAAEAIVLIYQDYPVGADKGGTDRTDLRARRIGAVVA